MTTEEERLESLYGYWNEHPQYPLSDWKYQVENSETRQGYWSWVVDQESQAEEQE